ncbi:MAG: PadR family transcriptional regulator [Longimicrobiales bacterium]|nr:PadR family transcriptional regulator [Longimicrobiales bacterium]
MTRLEILQGTLDLLILRTLSAGPRHGYQIARAIKETSDEVLQVEEGALYPALHRIEGRGWIESRWGVSENNRRAKFYELTAVGRKALEAETRSWNEYVAAVGRVMDPATEGTS